MGVLKKHYTMLAKNGDLIEEIYHARSSGIAATEQTSRALAKMETARVVLCDEDGLYRLQPKFRTTVDDLFDRDRIFSAGTPISEEVGRMADLAEAMRITHASGDEAGHIKYVDEMVDTILDLQFSIDDQIRIFDVMLRNGYHDARTLEEKIKRNAYYQKRAQNLTDAVSDIGSDEFRNLFRGAHAGDVRRRFNRDIISRIDVWSTILAGLIQEMLKFMNRSKEVSARTKRFRAMAHALRTVSASEQVEALEFADTQMAPEPIKPKVGFDFRSERNMPALVDQAKKLDPRTTRVERRKEFAAGEVRGEVEIVEDYSDEISDMIDCLMDEVRSGKTHSVREWIAGKEACSPDSFVMDIFDHMVNGEEGVSMRVSPESSHIYTIGVQDVILYKN